MEDAFGTFLDYTGQVADSALKLRRAYDGVETADKKAAKDAAEWPWKPVAAFTRRMCRTSSGPLVITAEDGRDIQSSIAPRVKRQSWPMRCPGN